MLLAGSMSALAQQATPAADKTLKAVVVKEKAEAPEGRDAVRAVDTSIGKGKQQLRDIPQSITVVTERLMDDRNLDTVKEALKATAGISFQAAEGGEEDIKLRGFSLTATGDIFVDSMRDPAFYERDTFSLDRMEVLRGSASMLFGRGSTGGAVNLVTKVPRLMDEHQVDVTVGSHSYTRVVGDFNLKTGESAALRINAMATDADNNGAGSSLDKKGVAATYRWGIGERDEFSVGINHLDNNNGMNYGMPWIRPTAAQSATNPNGSPASATTTLPLDPTAYYGMASDFNAGTATTATLSHLHRFGDGSELKTQIRQGQYTRDQRAGTVRLATGTSLSNFGNSSAVNRGTQLKIQDMDTLYVQSDYQTKFKAWGLQHEVLAGVDIANEKKTVYGARTATQGGVVPVKPTTTIGTPNDGASIDEASRVLRTTSDYESTGWGTYIQDMVQVAPHWKLLAGLRYDNLSGDYTSYGLSNTNVASNASYQMKVSELSKRLGVLYQPNELRSYHFSAATSFNTSGDAYSLGASNADTPPEQSINIELGAKLDSADKRFTTRVALFQSTKLHERNTDPLVNLVTLSGKRHVVGAEIDISGRLTPKWEIYGSYMWMPEANIDIGVAGSEGEGTRPSNTPCHSGSLWNTYQLTQQWRIGAGINFRGRQTPIRNPGWEVPAWVTADVMAEYQMNDKFTLKANVSNITNELYADQLYSGHYIPGAGRVVQLTGSLKF
ncbi:MAG: TonB-dependent siderophore receptor [Rhodoferax sp.]|nr:TonB-dependent siderophore receptor [Rhodoferax sp.]MDD2881820.1 TonB-dependent siderophore receptor [Rhodoferax sp.]